MTPEQALSVLRQALVTRQGLTVDDLAAVIEAWNILAKLIEKPEKGKKAE